MRWLGWVAALASAALWVASFEPWGVAGAGWVCLVPLLLAVRAGRAGWREAWLAGTLAWLGTVWWVKHVTTPGMVALCVYLGLYWAGAMWAWARACARLPETGSRNNLMASALLATAWVGLDWVRGWMFSGFPWHGLGVSQWRNVVLIQVAAVGGVDLLTWLMVFANGIGALTLVRVWREVRRTQRLRMHLDFSLTLAVLGACTVLGLRAAWAHGMSGRPLRVACIQGNIPQDEKFDAMRAEELMEIYAQQTGIASAAGPDLVLWPESATGAGLLDTMEMRAGLAELLDATGRPLLAGSVFRDADGLDYNAALLFSPGGGDVPMYAKEHLLPFGEYLPGRRWFPWLARWIPLPSDYAPGRGGGVMEVPQGSNVVRAGVVICFEDVLADTVRRRVRDGAELLVNLTNDAWFKDSPGAWQHAVHAVFRCVETRRPMVRCTNHGVTCVIDSAGRMTEVLRGAEGRAVGVRGFLLASVGVPAPGEPTWFLRGGWLFPLCCAGAAGLLACYELAGRHRPPRAAGPFRAAQEVSLTRRPNARD
jgi:apolipoprotein N-acyltransferase